jgi:hypothetical protein
MTPEVLIGLIILMAFFLIIVAFFAVLIGIPIMVYRYFNSLSRKETRNVQSKIR